MTFADLIAGVDAVGTDGLFQVASFPDAPNYLAARTPSGRLALLVRCTTEGLVLPVRLSGIEARYSVRCLMRDDDGQREERLSIIECLLDGSEEEGFFQSCVDRLVTLLGPDPTVGALGQAVNRLIEMFRTLSEPASTDVVGLLGELCTIYVATDATDAVRSWRTDPYERFDFLAGNLRLDVKATSGAERAHHISAHQATVAEGTVNVIASVLVSLAAGGTTVSELITLITARLKGDHPAVFRLTETVHLTMGAATKQTLQVRFDLERTVQSIRFFDAKTIPALRPPFPEGVYDVRFRSDLDAVDPTRMDQLDSQLDSQGRAILPDGATAPWLYE